MQIIVNGEQQKITCTTLAELMEHYKLNPNHVAAEVDGVIIERSGWSNYELEPGTKIELVHFVGGG